MPEEKQKKSIKKLEELIKNNSTKIVVTLLIFLLIIFLVNTIIISFGNSSLNKKLEEIKELNKPSKIQLTIIDCDECFDITSIIDSIKKQNIEIIDEEKINIDDPKAKELIKEYEIKNLPSILIFGEIDNNKTKFNNFEKIKDALVLNKVNAPYLDLLTNKINGVVKIIEIIDSSCKECISLNSISINLENAGVFISDWDVIEYNSEEAKKIISDFGVKKIPALLISEDIEYYDEVMQSLSQLNLENKKGFYPIHSIVPPYRDLTTNKIEGLVDLIMLTDSSCNECYDVSINKQILSGFGVFIKNENNYDINSDDGKKLIEKYNIEKAPVILLSPEGSVYDNFVNAWQSVGTKESDGWFVMRNPELIGISKNLINNELIK